MRSIKSKYVLITGAPGSKWSSVAKGIYTSPDVNQSDSSDDRKYKGYHFGAYWDPGMEFNNNPDLWDEPFTKKRGTKIIKSHTFAHNLEKLKTMGYPIVLVVRPSVECYYWWKMAGGMDIAYPLYKPYYRSDMNMWRQIKKQNADIQEFLYRNGEYVTRITCNQSLAEKLNISPEQIGIKYYKKTDINVYLYKKI